jgi:hypothetical protein
MFVFPFIIYFVVFLIMLPFGAKLSFISILHPSINPIRSIIKYINELFVLYYWLFVMIPMSLKTLKHRHGLIAIRNGNLICFGEVVCTLKSIRRVDAFVGVVKFGVTIHFDGGTHDCTRLNLCNKKPDVIKRELEHMAGLREDDERSGGERGKL